MYYLNIYLETIGVFGAEVPIHLSLFSFFLSFFSIVVEQNQEWWRDILVLTQSWYAVTAVEASRAQGWTQKETHDWLIETGLRIWDRPLCRAPKWICLDFCDLLPVCCFSVFSAIFSFSLFLEVGTTIAMARYSESDQCWLLRVTQTLGWLSVLFSDTDEPDLYG